jgi:hypothetical protein
VSTSYYLDEIIFILYIYIYIYILKNEIIFILYINIYDINAYISIEVCIEFDNIHILYIIYKK